MKSEDAVEKDLNDGNDSDNSGDSKQERQYNPQNFTPLDENK